jgi:FKBP-type peptidyl-prolyl cis-trans isomerase FkpA
MKHFTFRPLQKTLFLACVCLASFSCKKNSTNAQATTDNQIITNYIAAHHLNAKATGSGLYYVMTAQGTGTQPTSASTVTVSYKGYLTNGTVFDQNSQGYSVSLSSVIPGWQEGIPLFKAGGRGTLLIPSALGYGTQATGSIPANSVLIFDILLVSVP